MLYRAEICYVHILRNNDQPSWVLPGCSLDTDKPLCKAIFLGMCSFDSTLFQIFFYVTKRGFFGQCSNGAGTENMIGTEKYFCIFMSFSLILAGEVQVNIRRLFIAGKSKEGLKRNIKAVPTHLGSADRTCLLRHICSATEIELFVETALRDFGVRIPADSQRREFRITALRTHVMRRQTVNLCNAGHKGYHTGADASPAADQITVLQRILYEFLRRHINHVVVVVQNGIQFCIYSFLYKGWRRLAIDAVHLGVDQVFEFLSGVFNFRREEFFRQQFNLLDLIRDSPGVGHNDLISGLFSQILELLEHLICCTEENRAGSVGVRKLFRRLQNTTVLFILGIQKMNVRRGDNRFAERASYIQYSPVKVLKDFDGTDSPVIYQKCIVADRLDFKVVVKRSNLSNCLIAFSAHYRSIELSHAAC